MEELNVKAVEFDDISKYMKYSIKPDFKAAGPVLGSKVKAFGAELAKVDAKQFMADIDSGITMEIDGAEVEITKDLVDLRIEGEDGYAVGMDGGVAVAIATELTQDLVDEGLAREIISKVQQMRKQQDFEMMDNVTIALECDDEVAAAVEKHKDYIMTETLATDLKASSGEGNVKINGHKTGITVERV
jgi:isoleucyl-tRNA synthetase